MARNQDECEPRRGSGSGDPRQARWSTEDNILTPISKRNCSNFDVRFDFSQSDF